MKGKYIVVIVVALLVVISGIRLTSSFLEKREIKEDTMNYLTESGYEKNEIRNIDVVNIGGNTLKYAVVATFADEPDVDYLYTYINNSNDTRIIQIDAINKSEENTMQHLEN